MKVTLINPSTFSENLRWDSSATYPPLGLCYVAAVLEKNGHSVNIIDAEKNQQSESEFLKNLRRQKPDIIGITSHTPKYNQTMRTIDLVKKQYPDIEIILGGPHASVMPRQILEKTPKVNYIVVGEGEFSTLDLINSIQEGKNLSEINGIFYKEGNKIIGTGPRKFIENLDVLPLPARHLLNNIKSYKSALRYKRLPVTSVITSRGCPYNCLFCTRVFGKFYREHSAEYVVNEVEHLINKYKIKEIHFVDDLFIFNKKRIEKICQLIKERKIDITWSCNARIDIIYNNMDIIKKIKNSGCWYISFGIESGNEDVLKYIRKGITLHQVRAVVNKLHKYGIFTKGYFMIGHPIDTKKSVEDTIRFAKSIPLDGVQFSLTVPYPGSELFEVAKKQKKSFFDSDNYNNMSSHSNTPVYVPDGLSMEYLKKIQKRAYKDFYFRHEYILRQMLKIKNIITLKKYVRSGLNYLKR